MSQAETLRVCAQCRSPFTEERPLSENDTLSTLTFCRLNSGEDQFACIGRYLASTGDDVYLDFNRTIWVYDKIVRFSVQRFYHQDCACLAQNDRSNHFLEQSCQQIQSVLRLIGFKDVTVKASPLPEHILRTHVRIFVGDGSKLFWPWQVYCLRITASLANFLIIFPSLDGQPFIDSQETDVKCSDVRQCVKRDFCHVFSEDENEYASAEALTLHGGLRSEYPISFDAHDLFLLMIFRQKLYERQQAKI